MAIRLMIIDNHDLVRTGLSQYFDRQPDITVAAEAANGDELLEKLKTVPADILLLDMAMPGLSGADLISNIRKLYPSIHILVLSMRDEAQVVLSAMKAGASGYICKNYSLQTLHEAIREVMATGKYLSPHIIERLASASTPTVRDETETMESAIKSEANNPLEHDWHNCEVSRVDNTDLVECTQKVKECQWVLFFGNKCYCTHPYVKQSVCHA